MDKDIEMLLPCDALRAYHGSKRTAKKKVPRGAELFRASGIVLVAVGIGAIVPAVGQGFMRDKKIMNDLSAIRQRGDDGLGPNSDIGNKLRALYGAVQEEGIPTKLLDLLDRLDEVERRSTSPKGKVGS